MIGVLYPQSPSSKSNKGIRLFLGRASTARTRYLAPGDGARPASLALGDPKVDGSVTLPLPKRPDGERLVGL